MVDFDILDEYGTTDERLRQFFTAEEPATAQSEKMTPAELRVRRRDVKLRAKFQKWMQAILWEHIINSLESHPKYAAVDMAWDSFPTNTAVVPLMQFAQGRIDATRAAKWLRELPDGGRYVKDGPAGETIDLPKFFEVNLNLLRSILTRRRAAQVEKYDRLWPYFKYEPRDQTEVGKLRADLVSQRMDIMADQYGYRHFQSQAILHMLLYARTVAFPRAYWEREVSLERVPGGVPRDAQGRLRTRTRVSREGLSWVLPHPSRVFFDNNYPLAALNEDNGPEYVGFWDVTRWGDVVNNANFFNRRQISFTQGLCDLFTAYWPFFNQYFSTIIPPALPEQPAYATGANDVKNRVGLYTGQMEQTSVIVSNFWVKVRPQNWGWGRYPHPVWVHLKVAGDATVVYAKICPSSPAAVFAYNENDGRTFNISMAHELMPFQDQLSNLTSQLLETVKQDLLSVAVLNTDVFPDDEKGRRTREEFEALLSGRAQYATMQTLEVSFQHLAQLGIKPEQVFTVVRAAPNTQIEQIFKAITEVLNLADRLLVMSQQEVGQQMSHEASATESHNISKATDSIYDFISTGLDEGRAAVKRICFESLVACGSSQVELTVASRYPSGVVKQAGFTVQAGVFAADSGFARVIGSKLGLVHDYIFTSRDGGDRPAGQQAGQVLVQMLQAIGGLEPNIQQAVVGAMGKAKVFEILNQIFRSIDAGVDLKLELKPGESDHLLVSQDEQIKQGLARLAQMVQRDSADLTQVHQAISAIFELIGKLNPGAGQLIAAELQKTAPPPAANPQLPPPAGGP